MKYMYILYYCCFVNLFLCLLFILLLLLHTLWPIRAKLLSKQFFRLILLHIRSENAHQLHFAILYQFNTKYYYFYTHYYC